MIRLRLSELAKNKIGSLVGSDTEITGFSIDTRTLKNGDLFFAIVGPQFDGHEFCQDAVSLGASAVVVSRDQEIQIPQLKVSNTRVALQKTAELWRKQFDIPFVAVTGSSGKTTVKEMIAAIFRVRAKTLSTLGNLNNDIGVPLTLLRLDASDQYAVIEIGANHIGEIRDIVSYTRPDIAVITMIGPSHLEGFGSIEGVSEAKSEIFSVLSDDGVAVLNRDDKYYGFMKERAGAHRSVSFGFNSNSDVRGCYKEGKFSISSSGSSEIVNLQLLGEHNRLNALAAAGVGLSAGFLLSEIKTGLESIEAVKGRLKVRRDVERFKLIDDSYNANPASMKAAINVLAEQPGVRCLVAGDMGELGDEAESLHREIGAYAKRAGVDYFFCIGRYMQFASETFGSDKSKHCLTMEGLIEEFGRIIPKSANVLVKGSRAAGMERFIDAFVINTEESLKEEQIGMEGATL